MIKIARGKATPGAIRVMLAEAGIDVTASTWPEPGFVVANDETLVPTPLRGVLIVNGIPRYSQAWL